MTPSFIKVLIDGQPVPDFLLTLDCTITHELNRHSTCSVQFREPPAARFFYEDKIGKPMVLRAVDADGAELELFKGIMRQGDADYELNGSIVLTFTGIGKSFLLDTFNRSQTFNQASLQAAFDRLTAPAGGTFAMSQPGPLDMIQFNETDWSFLHRLVDRFGGFLRPVGDSVDAFDSFQGDAVQLAWRSENGLNRFRSTGRLTPHIVFGVNFERESATSKETLELLEDVAAESSIPDVRKGASDGSGNLGLTSGLWDKFLASKHDRFEGEVRFESQRQVMSQCRGVGESRVPEIVTGGKIEITNNGEVDGKYGVIKVIHSWKPGRGYRNEFVCTPFTKYVEEKCPAVSRYYGPEIARVAATSPPGVRGVQVRVNFQWETNNDTGFIPLSTPNAGADRGICFVPEVGDEVLVFFRGGDSCRPFIMGSLWNDVEAPPLEDLHGGEYPQNDLKRIVTKSGNRLVFDDKPGKETMVMATPNHVRVSLFDGGQTLLLHSDGDVHIHAGGTVHMRCKQFLREVG